MSEGFSRRVFLGNSLAIGGGLLLGGCDSGAAPTAVLSTTPTTGGRLRIGIIDGDQSGNLDAHKPVGGGIIRGWALYSKFWEWNTDVS
ncbi:ABC transporter substrate-binding protein, partial [Pseudomonas sp. K5002]|nr:ABC transporter substrate-binding protein [Pseudomonas sp. K5002]